jgi:CBS domain-containing protein
MSKKGANPITDRKQLRQFTRFLLRDIKALEKMLEGGLIESDIQRIGAEQELSLVDRCWRPKPIAVEVLNKIKDGHFAYEIGKFNLEINLDPLTFRGDCLSKMKKQLTSLLFKLEDVIKDLDAHLILVGILPTVRRMDLGLENLTPSPRFIALTDSLIKMRGAPYELNIRGTDDLITKHNSPMFEACNTSFQVHLQVSPEDIVQRYNIAQAISAPVLAAGTNSPLLLGRRLWKETRIALFEQAVDTRQPSYISREKSARVTFGNGWAKDSILEILKDDIARYKVLLSIDIEEDSLEALEEGRVPKLQALQAYIGTVYRWNRVCYGIFSQKPHLRIENRILPSGPTVKDEIANAAFLLGLMNGMPDKHKDITKVMEFDDAKTNFLKAAERGLDTQFKWTNGKVIPADKLIIKELLPIAKAGLQEAQVKEADINNYLEIIRERVASRKTGSRWILDSFSKLSNEGTKEEALVAITAGIIKRQKKGEPVHKWELAEINEAGSWTNRCSSIEQIMSTDLFTVHEDDPIDLAVNIMNWKHINHIPVENEQGELVGLVTSETLLRHYVNSANLLEIADTEKNPKLSAVRDIMIKKPVTVSPETSTVDAVSIMHKNNVGCLPVVKNKKLVGIVTKRDFMNISAHLIQELLHKDSADGKGTE